MKMTTRGRYGLRAMLELARCFGGAPVLMSTLAEKERLSRKYLHTLLTALKSAGLVCSVRGAGGGFQLSRTPEEIRLSEILHAVEGPLSLVDCVPYPQTCDRASGCAARRAWQALSDKIEEVLDGICLKDLITREAVPAAEPQQATDHRRERGCARRYTGPACSPAHHTRPRKTTVDR